LGKTLAFALALIKYCWVAKCLEKLFYENRIQIHKEYVIENQNQNPFFKMDWQSNPITIQIITNLNQNFNWFVLCCKFSIPKGHIYYPPLRPIHDPLLSEQCDQMVWTKKSPISFKKRPIWSPIGSKSPNLVTLLVSKHYLNFFFENSLALFKMWRREITIHV